MQWGQGGTMGGTVPSLLPQDTQTYRKPSLSLIQSCPSPAAPRLCALLPSSSSSSSSPVPYLVGVQSAEAVWPLPGLGLAIKPRGQAEGVTRIWELLAGESRGARVGLGGSCLLDAADGILPGSHRAQSWFWIWPYTMSFGLCFLGHEMP